MCDDRDSSFRNFRCAICKTLVVFVVAALTSFTSLDLISLVRHVPGWSLLGRVFHIIRRVFRVWTPFLAPYNDDVDKATNESYIIRVAHQRLKFA